MNALVLKGKTRVDNMEFNHIEGGFGQNKKAMLVKDIAGIHQRETREVNQSINMNRKRFKDNVDIIDLKDNNFAINLIDNGIYTQNSINASKNIYLLSERGYSKLLKILEDDFAWEQYEKLVDGYFNMRKAIKDNAINVVKQQETEARLNNSKARQANVLLKIAKATKVEEYKQILHSYASQIITGKTILPLPEVHRKTYSAKEIGDIVGLSANMVGRLSNSNNLKTSQYGKLFYDKSPHSHKEVETFRYYDNVIPVLEELSSKVVTA